MRSLNTVVCGAVLLVVAFLVPGVSTPVAGAYTIGEHPCEYCETYEKQQAEQAAKEQKEANERAAKAAEEKKATEERQQREAVEREQHEAAERHREETEREQAQAQAAQEATENAAKEQKTKEAAALRCVVPSLKGDSLNGAIRGLRSAHCKLGKVSGLRKGRGAHVVVAQQRKPGTTLASGTAVGVTLGQLAKHVHR